jgi:hypothetical protein
MQLLQWDRLEFSRFVRLFTGHNNLNYHRYNTQETDDDTCRLCLEEVETSEHLFSRCLDLTTRRTRSIGKPLLTKPDEAGQIPLSGARHFISLICQALQEVGVEKL